MCKTQDEKTVLARVPLSELQVTLWPHRQESFGLSSSCNADDDDIVCCAEGDDDDAFYSRARLRSIPRLPPCAVATAPRYVAKARTAGTGALT